MPQSSGHPLVVEGVNDKHALLQLLRRAQVLAAETTAETSPLQFIPIGNKSELLKDIPVRWKEANTTIIGYVLDADDEHGDPPGMKPTWNAVCHRLKALAVEAPAELPQEGFVGRIGELGPKIGVWIMPDNRSDGAIEEFLLEMVDREAPLFVHAKQSTTVALDQHQAFDPSNRSKAELACWLAWQAEPAQRYGEAMQAGKFDQMTETATAFVNWIRQLYGL